MEQQQLQATRRRRSLRSSFSGTAGKFFFLRLGLALLAIIPFVGLPNSLCIWERYKCRNTQIVGMPLQFTGKAGELLKKIIVWGFFTVITIGIYGLVLAPLRYEQWKTEHTIFGPVTL
ncbi:MAG: hypothetical protein MR239_05195 [Clostridiales bacterium]|nr:hypothetical protein [Clostridiales bacterium]MDY4655557.1 hypothetical protein [Eubacteriales bacterium]